MRKVKCPSGSNGWQALIQEVYENLADLKSFNAIYGIVKRLGFETTEDLWEKNPMIEGSTKPSDFRIVS